jgi:putative membrane protein insertion efficiency factor
VILRRTVIGLIVAYKRWISPLFPPACRFHPSCSAYARDAVEIHGVWRGGGLALWRLLRCQPFSRGGFDPVPPRCRGSARRIAG